MDRCTKNLQEKLLYQSKIIVECGDRICRLGYAFHQMVWC
ncbi:unnamed protein product [Callosobruchus maculatus]|uniref:Uncharacterized protein n=1 Tax=Callosobruchus maculatus TaxID=64391 RepID=A0A653CQD1_CALMS|nr:unnamed protein product [Callosobruchus maculatus]